MKLTHEQSMKLCVLLQCVQLPQALGLSPAETVTMLVERVNKRQELEKGRKKPADKQIAPGKNEY
jgi:hypothetical protein